MTLNKLKQKLIKIDSEFELLIKGNESAIYEAVKMIEQESRGEWSVDTRDWFIDNLFQKKLIALAKSHLNNKKILRKILSALGFFANRYELYDDDVYMFFEGLLTLKDKDINFDLANHIVEFPQFKGYNKSWDFIISIPELAPKKISFIIFMNIIRNRIDSLPDSFLNAIISKVNLIIDLYTDTLDIDTKKDYKKLRSQLQKIHK